MKHQDHGGSSSNKPRLKKYEQYETDTHKVVILVDTETNGELYAESHVTPKVKPNEYDESWQNQS
jgi:hypothetical protein